MGAERERIAGFGRLEDGLLQAGDWYRWGPYVSERQWGTVREDYSADGNAWDYLPHDHARSRAYRWGEDGLAGFCDIQQRLCLALALWNGRDPILKERAFGLTGPQGNHGEDVKEYWWYLDAIPSHAWNRWRYHYPQAPFPYQELIDVNAGRNRYQPEYELLDTGAFDGDRYWVTEVHYAKAGPDDLLMVIQLTNACPEADTIHVLPTAWFRNTWSWGHNEPRPAMRASGDRSVAIDHPIVGTMELIAAPGPDGADPQLLFCENETNLERLYGADPATPYPKDGINDHVVHDAPPSTPSGSAPSAPSGTRSPWRPDRPPSSGSGSGPPLSGSPGRRRHGGGGARRRVHRGDGRAPGRGRRVLRRAHAGERQYRRGHGAAPGVRWHAVEQAAVLLRRHPLAGRRPGPAGPPGGAQDRAERQVAQLRRVRHHLHARQVGVSLVRRLGPGLPLRHPGPPGPGVRQVPADHGVPGVVPAPERGAAGLRVGLRRRQPAGARLGGAGGLRHRRRPRPGLPVPGVRQAPSQLHLVGEQGGRRGQQRLRGRLPRPGQHRADRPFPPAGRLPPGAVRCHRLDGRLRAGDARHRRCPELVRPPPGAGPGPEVPRALRRHPERPGPAGPVGRRRRALL